jgi:hypothetical protein
MCCGSLGEPGEGAALRLLWLLPCVVQVGHAMESLKKSMKWDEDVYGLEYDLVRGWSRCLL